MADVAMTGSRPRQITVALWLMGLGAVMLLAGGLVTASVSFDTLRQVAPPSITDESVSASLWLYRGAGVLFAAAGAGLLALTLRSRRRDPRFRRATVSLALVIVVLVAVAAVFAGAHILAVLSVLPIIAGALFLGRSSSVAWFAGEDLEGYFDD